MSRLKVWRAITCLFIISSCVKVLLIPSYRSTDFDVHRHWKAVTLHLPLSEWYRDDEHVNTRHTFDYPPGFAWLEYMWTHNPITHLLLKQEWLDNQCFALLPDPPDGSLQPISSACLTFMRSTVIVGDLVFWSGAYILANSVGNTFSWPVFLAFVLHPGLLWLDAVHFQYNSLMIGLFIISLSCMLRANKINSISSGNDAWFLLGAAIAYATVLTMKHLYLIFAPWYGVYLFRRFCFQEGISTTLSIQRFALLGTTTLCVLILPALPLVLTSTRGAMDWGQQLISRLFPFGRGLVHDYWAGNLWAFYAAASKVISLPEVTPRMTAALLLMIQSPGLWCAWNAAANKNNSLLLLSMAYCAAGAFFVSFHVHEKAILNVLVPLTAWGLSGHTSRFGLWWEYTAWGTFGLVPLLYEPRELLLKVASLTCYLSAFAWYHPRACPDTFHSWHSRLANCVPFRFHITVLLSVWVVVDILPLQIYGRLEFLPLAVTSLSCAAALTVSLLRLSYWMLSESTDSSR